MARPPKTIDWAEVAGVAAERLATTLWDQIQKRNFRPPQPPEPEKTKATEDPYEMLGVHRGLSLDVYEAVYKTRAKSAHPDKGGSSEEMQRLNTAIKKIREELKR